MSELEREQNKRINQHQRLINELREKIKTVELDLEPSGRISEAFEHLESHIERLENRIENLENRIEKRFNNSAHQINQLAAKLDIVIEHLTHINDLPEE